MSEAQGVIIFRPVIESRERAPSSFDDGDTSRGCTPSGWSTPGLSNNGGPRLQSRGGRSGQTSVFSLIDLARSERATSDKERTREDKCINTSLHTLGSVIGTLAENAAKSKKCDHFQFPAVASH